MGLIGKLEELVLKTKIPSKAIAAAASAAISAPIYLSQLPPNYENLFFGALTITAFPYVSKYISNLRELDELGISTNELKGLEKKIEGEEKKTGLAAKAREILTHPALFGTAAGTTTAVWNAIRSQSLERIANQPGILETAQTASSEAAFNAWVFSAMGFAAYQGARRLPLFAPGQFEILASAMFSAAKGRIMGWKKQVELLEAFGTKWPCKTVEIGMAQEYVKREDFDSAVLHVKKAASIAEHVPLPSYKPRDFYFRTIPKAHKGWKAEKSSLIDGIHTAQLCNELGKAEIADKILLKTAQTAKTAETSAIIGWWTSEAFNRPETARLHWAEAAKLLLANDAYRVEPMGEGIHHVYRIGPQFIKDELIFKEATQKEVEFESRMLEFAASRIGGMYTVPRELATLSYSREGARNALVMSYMPGQNLIEMAREGKLSTDDLLLVTDYMAMLHSIIPAEMSEAGRVDMKLKAKAAAENAHLQLPEELQRRILRNMEFVTESINGQYPVFAQDGHGGQWQLNSDRIAKLDHNDNGVDSFFRDLAKLHMHPEMPFEANEFYAMQQESHSIYHAAGLDGMGPEKFSLLHLHAMMLQGLSFAAAWSVPGMSHMRGKRAAAVSRAIELFGIVRQNHPREYHYNKPIYDGLAADFKELEELLAPAA